MHNRSDESIFIRTCYVPYRGVSLPTALEHGGRGPWDDGAVMAVGERTILGAWWSEKGAHRLGH